jgi:hypothetical protein
MPVAEAASNADMSADNTSEAMTEFRIGNIDHAATADPRCKKSLEKGA